MIPGTVLGAFTAQYVAILARPFRIAMAYAVLACPMTVAIVETCHVAFHLLATCFFAFPLLTWAHIGQLDAMAKVDLVLVSRRLHFDVLLVQSAGEDSFPT